LRSINSRKSLYGLLTFSAVLIHGATAGNEGLELIPIAALTRNIPTHPDQPVTGSQFAATIANLDAWHREQAVKKELLGGNLPSFLRNLAPVTLTYRPTNGKIVNATVFVMPEYLAIGSDKDFLRIPMNLYTAAAVASRMGFVLPTRKIVNAIYQQSSFHFAPQPMTAGPQMRSTEYYRVHNEKIEEQSRTLGIMSGVLVSGDKKDIVLTNLLEKNPGRIAIYGWHRLSGTPIQPLSTVHGACYEDYSHGVRLVSEKMIVDGQPRSIYDVLKDATLSPIVSDEGPIPDARDIITRTAGEMPCWQS